MDRKVAGVAGGIARHLDVDPVIIRVAFVVLTLFGGAGLIVYAACWILLPEDGQQHTPLGLDDRSRSVALILVGILGVALLVGQWDWFWVPGPLILVALVVWLVMSKRNDQAAHSAAAPPPPSYVPGAGPDSVSPEQRWGFASAQATQTTPPTAPDYEPAPRYDGAATTPPAYGRRAYEQATYQQPPSEPTHPTAVATPPRPRNPRKRGPILFWFTMAMAALAVGVVSIVDVSGVDVPGSTYPAVVVGVVGLMLLIGSFWGRAGGLILVGLIASTATAGALAAEKVDTDRTVIVPRSASQVLDSYDFDAGEYELDLTRLSDPEALDGRTIQVTGDFGEIVVVTPAEMDVAANARIDGPGGFTLFGDEHGGIDTTYNRNFDGGTDVPAVTLDLQLDVGHIEVRTQPFEEIR
jgi:phage shock protein PspC (stress-responsive transcriptional regulator)